MQRTWVYICVCCAGPGCRKLFRARSCSEAQALLATAAHLGLGLEDVEMELVMAQGNWEASAEVLQSRALGGATEVRH